MRSEVRKASFVVLPLLLLVAASSRIRPVPAPAARPPLWYSDLAQARLEARQARKPLFVVFRDERDEKCKRFDDRVARFDGELAELAEEFVLVRLVDMRGVNLNLFDFDYDLTWAGFFMNANAHLYGRFGGRDSGAADAHLTLPGLRYAMRRALQAYRSVPDAPAPTAAAPRRVEQYARARQRSGQECIHCHHVYEYSRDALRTAGRWRNEMAWVYPWPENIGLTVDTDQADRIRDVKADSAAERAGLRAGDRLKTLNRYPIASYGDIQYALHRAPAEGALPIVWERDGAESAAEIPLSRGWRETDLSWRASMWRLPPAPSVEGEDLTPEAKAQLALSADRLAFRQYETVWPAAKAAGIQGGDIIVGIDDKTFSMTMLQFLIHIRMHHQVGDRIVVNLFRNGRRMDLPLTLGANP